MKTSFTLLLIRDLHCEKYTVRKSRLTPLNSFINKKHFIFSDHSFYSVSFFDHWNYCYYDHHYYYYFQFSRAKHTFPLLMCQSGNNQSKTFIQFLFTPFDWLFKIKVFQIYISPPLDVSKFFWKHASMWTLDRENIFDLWWAYEACSNMYVVQRRKNIFAREENNSLN